MIVKAATFLRSKRETERGRKRQREREGERGRETERDRQTERERDRESMKQVNIMNLRFLVLIFYCAEFFLYLIFILDKNTNVFKRNFLSHKHSVSFEGKF